LDIVRVTNEVHVERVQCSEQTARLSLADDSQTVCMRVFIKVLFMSKVVNSIHIHPVCDEDVKDSVGMCLCRLFIHL
jgi:hypothetical protein